MSVTLDPTVVQMLRRFGRRRLRLILTRGVCTAVVTFLVCLAVVAFIDWYWLLTDNVRWALSGATYGSALLVTWITCLRRLMNLPDTEAIASQIEKAEPDLRENLLSAVELATDDPAQLHDSPVFRSLLQSKVARQMGRIRIPRLLPMRLVAKWAVTAAALLVAAAFLLTSNDPRFRQLATRAVLPGANIARVSRIQVEVLQPTPHSLTLAEDETISVVVEVTGGRVDEVTLETFTPQQGTVRHTMRGRTGREYVSNIHVADEFVQYRILAGDAITERFRIESRPRPEVLAFHKTYTFPDYSQLPERTVTETHGDLQMLAGTQAEVVFELDQHVSEAELRMDPGRSGDTRVVPLTPCSDDHRDGILWKAVIPIDEAAIYKVHLVSTETGFENIFSPRYEILPIPDLIPRAGFVDLPDSTLLLPPNDILSLQAVAQDDLPLVRMDQLISVNGRDWVTYPLEAQVPAEDDGFQLTASWNWDLESHRLKTGDEIITRLAATDRKGQVGESIPLRIIVSAPDFDPNRHAAMQRKVELFDTLADFSELLQEQKTSALEIIDRLKQSSQASEQDGLDQAALLDLASRQREQSEKLVSEILAVERDMPVGADAYDLDLTGRIIARLHHESANVPPFLLKAIQHLDDPKRNHGDLDELKRTFERSADDAENVAKHYQHLMSHNVLNAVAFDLNAVLRQQRLIVDSPTQTWQRLVRQETVVVNQLKILEQLIQEHRQRMPGSLGNHLQNVMTWSESHRQRLHDAMESEDKLPQLRQASAAFYRELEQKQKIDVIDGGLPGRLIGARRDFHNRAGSLYVPLEQLARAAEQENRLTAQASTSADSVAGQQLLQQSERFVAEIDLKLRRSLDQLRTRRELTQTRRDADSQYAADAGLTHRAVMSLLNQHRVTNPQESSVPAHLLEIAPAYRILEAGHELTVTQNVLAALIGNERWNSQEITGRMDHPRQWDVVQQGFELASQRLREAKVDNGIIAKLDQIRWSPAMKDAQRKISERRWKRDESVTGAHELVQIRQQLNEVVEELQSVMADARAVIAQFAPTIPQMAQQAADQLRKMEESTSDTADIAEEPNQPDTTPQLAELQLQQNAVNQQIADLFEALVEDANSQDLVDDKQRERARDADDSIAAIREPALQMNDAMDRAQQTESGRDQAKDLAVAAEHQEETAQALEMVAEHFQRLQDGLDVAESRAELRQAEDDLGLAEQMNQRFDNVERLSETGSQTAADLMAELEAELQANPAMQQALSEISRNTLQEALNALNFAAQDEQNLRRANERSDRGFQEKKKELVAELRTLAAEASRLSGALVAQANQSAAQGKTPEAQKKFAETQQQLNQAVATANAARDDQLLSDLADTARNAQSALETAAKALNEAKQQTAMGKDEEIHADDKARDAQRKDSERRRQQFHEQQKRTARDLAKRADDVKRRADTNVRNAEKQVQSADRRLQQAKQKLAQKPDDAGLQRNVQTEETRKQGEQQKVDVAKALQAKAEQEAIDARSKSDEVNKKPLPPLDAPNPATQLADQYAGEAIPVMEAIRQKADQLVASTDFGDELAPQKGQLAAALTQQQSVSEDVALVAEDVARAARHERRLDNSTAAQTLQATADDIQDVVNDESAQAEKQLASSVQEAEQAQTPPTKTDGETSQNLTNVEALKAQSAVGSAEAAIEQQAGQLSDVVQPLIAAAVDDAAAADQPDSSATSAPTSPLPSGDEPNASASGEAAPAGQNGQAPSMQNPTPAELVRGQQLARTLDELDRQQAASALAAAASGEQTPQPAASPLNLDSLSQQALAQQASLSAARLQAQRQAMMALGQTGTSSVSTPAATGPESDFSLSRVNRTDGKEWGQLRSKAAEDLTRGRSEAVADEYRKSVDTYFRVLAERARKKK